MRKRIFLVLLAVATAAVTVPLIASADDDGRVTFGVRLDFFSETEAVGTFAACCAVNDAGNASAKVTDFKETGERDHFEATNTFDGSKGSITILLRGTTGPSGSNNHVARGRWRVIEGSGAYHNLAGQGRFTAVTNQLTGALTAIDEGEVSGAPD